MSEEQYENLVGIPRFQVAFQDAIDSNENKPLQLLQLYITKIHHTIEPEREAVELKAWKEECWKKAFDRFSKDMDDFRADGTIDKVMKDMKCLFELDPAKGGDPVISALFKYLEDIYQNPYKYKYKHDGHNYGFELYMFAKFDDISPFAVNGATARAGYFSPPEYPSSSTNSLMNQIRKLAEKMMKMVEIKEDLQRRRQMNRAQGSKFG